MESAELERLTQYFFVLGRSSSPTVIIPPWWEDIHTSILCEKLDSLEKEFILLHQENRQEELNVLRLYEPLCLYLAHLKLIPNAFRAWIEAVPARLYSVLGPTEQTAFILKGQNLTKDTFPNREAFEAIFPEGQVPAEAHLYREIYPIPDELIEVLSQEQKQGILQQGIDVSAFYQHLWQKFDVAQTLLFLIAGLGASWAWEFLEQRYQSAPSPPKWIEDNAGFLVAMAAKIPVVEEWGAKLMCDKTPEGQALAKLCFNAELVLEGRKQLISSGLLSQNSQPTLKKKKSSIPPTWRSLSRECLPPSEQLSHLILTFMSQIMKQETSGEEEDVSALVEEVEALLQRYPLSLFTESFQGERFENFLKSGLMRGMARDALLLTLDHFDVLSFHAGDYEKVFPRLVDATLKLWVLGNQHVFARAAEHLFRFSLIPASRSVGGEKNRHEPLATMLVTTLTDLLRLPDTDELFQQIAPFSSEERVLLLMALGDLATSKCERVLGHAKKHAKRNNNELLLHVIESINAHIHHRRYALSPRERMDRVGVILRVLSRMRSQKDISIKDAHFVQELKEGYGIEHLV